MADLKITSAAGLVEATIKVKQEIYYLVTVDNLNSLKQKSLLSDLFIFMASLAWGAYFSVVTTIKAIPIDTSSSTIAKNILQPLDTLQNVFFWAGIFFSILSAIFIYLSFAQVKELKNGKLDLNDIKNE